MFLGSRGGGDYESLVPGFGAGDGDGERWGGAATPAGSLNELIVVALTRLQEDMQSVLQRLQTLEALTAGQVTPLRPQMLVQYDSNLISAGAFQIFKIISKTEQEVVSVFLNGH